MSVVGLRCDPTAFHAGPCSRRATRHATILYPDVTDYSIGRKIEFDLCWQHDRSLTAYLQHAHSIAPSLAPVRLSQRPPEPVR